MGSKREKSNPTAVELWELKLLKEVARQFRTEDREFLETELLSRLVELKSKPKRHVRQWKNYLWTALWNHAANFMRDRPMIHKTHLDPVESGAEDFEEDHTVGIVLPSLELSLDRQIAFSEVRKELGPKLRRLCELLEEKNGNQVAVARRLRKHRNTIRLWIGRIRKGFKRHGYPQR